MNNKRCAFLMSSCDVYEDLWNPFYECLDKFWPDCPYPIYLNTEHKQFKSHKELHFQVTTINQCKLGNMTWSARFMDALNQIDSEYIFLVLDDYFACAPVESKYFEEVIDLMDKDKSIASFQFYGKRMRNAGLVKTVGGALDYIPLWPNGWKTHFVPTIWRKTVLLKWLRRWESIWAFEGYGSARARRWPKRYSEKVFVVRQPDIYDYLWIKDCSVVINSCWLDEPEVYDFFTSNGIEVDYSHRGKMTKKQYEDKTMYDVLKKYSWWQIVVKSFNYVRSYF